MGKYSDELLNKSVTSPEKEVVIVDEEYISKESVTLTINAKEGFSQEFVIMDSNGKECYKFKTKSFSDTFTICDPKEKPLLSIKMGFSSDKIFSEKRTKKEIGKIKPKNSTKAHKYEIEYTNKATRKEEILNLNCSSNYRTSGVFHGREKEGAPLISRFSREINNSFLSSKSTFTIEIAPNVDILIMVALCVYVSLKKTSAESTVLFAAAV